MSLTINEYNEKKETRDGEKTNENRFKEERDSLVFHGVEMDDLEKETEMDDADIKKNLIDHKIRSMLSTEFGMECNAKFKHAFRRVILHMYNLSNKIFIISSGGLPGPR